MEQFLHKETLPEIEAIRIAKGSEAVIKQHAYYLRKDFDIYLFSNPLKTSYGLIAFNKKEEEDTPYIVYGTSPADSVKEFVKSKKEPNLNKRNRKLNQWRKVWINKCKSQPLLEVVK